MTENTDIMRLRRRVVAWLSDYLRTSGKAGFVIGLSGGIDSLTLALLAQEAASTCDASLLALVLRLDEDVDYADNDLALRLAGSHGLPYEVLDLTGAYHSYKQSLFAAADPVAYTNLKARLRSSTLYYYANCRNLLVLGTVNRGEFMIGYFPKNASAGDIMPMADLSKHNIRDIAGTYNVTDEIRLRKASGCVHGEIAEEEWGFTEDELDVMCDDTMHPPDEGHHPVPSGVRSRFSRLLRSSKHKREFYPMFFQSSDSVR
jgi:NAD+ synthase